MFDEKSGNNLEHETKIAFKFESIMLFTYLLIQSIVSRLFAIDLSKWTIKCYIWIKGEIFKNCARGQKLWELFWGAGGDVLSWLCRTFIFDRKW